MKNNNGASVRKLSDRSLQNNRMRNFFAILAIILTGILFTAVFSLTSGAMQVAQEETMREVGGKFHAGLKAATTQQYESVIADPMVKSSSYTIFIGVMDNIIKHSAELRYLSEDSRLEDLFITLEEGHIPVAENEIIVDTFTLDEFNLPYVLGEKISLKFSFMGETVEDEFVVSGWYQGDNVAHASELIISESYWMKLKGSYTDEDFVNWQEEHPEDNGVGLKAVNLFFDDEHNLEEKVQTVIRNAGYEPETELDYGVNWAYMTSRVESVDPLTFILLSGAVMVILITGYLIIYNIFQISVISDIRFYGLLKTIGTTKKQIQRLVRRQAVKLSLIGIPIGLVMGYGIGKFALPFALSINDYQGMEVSMKFDPMILVFGAGFSALTVFLSSRKPGKIAGSVSPIEAVKYTEAGKTGKASLRRNRKRRKRNKAGSGFSAVSMAFSNLGRNKRSAFVVIMAMSLSIILLAVIMTAVGSFQLDSYMEQRIAGDYMLGNINVISSASRSGEVNIEPEFLALADRQAGIENRLEMWVRHGIYLQVDDKAQEQFAKLNAENKLRQDMHNQDRLERILRGEKSLVGFCYGYSEELFSNMKVLDGTLDIEKFMTGDYILLTQILGSEFLPPEDHVYHPGDIVTLEKATEDSQMREITNAAGETIDFEYVDLEEKEYEVMAIVELPGSMTLNRFSSNACDMVLPLIEFKTEGNDVSGSGGYAHCFKVSYEVEDEAQAAFEAAVKEYTDHNTEMGYASKESLRGEFGDMITVIATIGIALAVVIALIGILNFINAVITQIISRRREFAMLQSIGMTNGQLQKTLICEGISYVAISGVISFVLGSLLSWAVLTALNNVILFFAYRFQILPFVIMIPLLILVAVIAPTAAYRNLRKKSIVERLQESE
ncbi:MAG: ABC transporter permease [Lachnospiraceae bacterium]|nr:ABC transporter permease [Lachnospiraceae bacterium]